MGLVQPDVKPIHLLRRAVRPRLLPTSCIARYGLWRVLRATHQSHTGLNGLPVGTPETGRPSSFRGVGEIADRRLLAGVVPLRTADRCLATLRVEPPYRWSSLCRCVFHPPPRSRNRADLARASSM